MTHRGPDVTGNPRTVVDAIRRHSETRATHDALVFLKDGEEPDGRVPYGELDRRLRAIAAGLQRSSSPGDRVLLVYPPGIEYVLGFLGCIYAGLIPVPAYPPHPARLERMLPRLRAVAADAQANFVLSLTALAPLFETLELGEAGRSPQLLFSDELENSPAEDWTAPSREPESVAFLQYTSGSTGNPKGVILHHRHVLLNIEMFSEAYELTDQTSLVTWLPPYHDMGLIGCILGPLVAGGTSVMMSPESFLRRPVRWLEAISRYGSNVTGGPNFAYELCLNKVTAADRSRLDLSTWAHAINAAEPIRASTLVRFTEVFADCGFAAHAMQPTYGLAEGTLLVSTSHYRAERSIVELDNDALADGRVAAAAPGRRSTAVISCGQPAGDFVVAITDPATGERCAEDRVGEIWLSGSSVAAGYWQRPAETAQTFEAQLPGEPERRYLRTGDLGFMRDDEAVIAGRLKDLLIIAGRNHHPHDIERTVESLDARLRPGCGAAFTVDDPKREHLVVVHEVSGAREADGDLLLGEIRRAVNEEHQLVVDAVVLIAPRTIPKTSSGKVQRGTSRQDFLDGRLDIVADWRSPRMPAANEPQDDQLEQRVTERVSAVLGIPPSELDRHVRLPEYGMGFVEAAAIVSELEAELRRPLPETLLTDRPTLRELTDFLAGTPDGQGDGSTITEPELLGGKSVEDVERWLRGKLAQALEVPAADIVGDRRFEDYGLDSLGGASFVADLEMELGCSLPETLLLDHRTPRALAEFLKRL